MNRQRGFPRLFFLLLPLLMILGVSAITLSSPRVSAATAPTNGCAGPVPGQYIYDCSGLLTSAEIANLETQAAAVVRAGAPTVVYLQVRDANAEQTLQDAIDLMNRWNVESSPGAHDGFVMFFNLQSGNLRHGQVALYAGEKHYKDGNLPQAELDRIRTDVMTPLLKNEQTAAGIAAGLQMVAHDLRYGPPPPPAYQTVSAAIGRIPFNVLALLFAGVVAFFFIRLRGQSPVSSHVDDFGLGSLATPATLSPAMAGALLKGRVTDAQMEGTLLDFARRGLLVIEPAGQKKVRVELLGDGKDLTGYEGDLWSALSSRADTKYRTVFSDELRDIRKDWGATKSILRRELIERGWYDPETAGARRRPFYIAGAFGVLGAAAGVLLILLSQEGWAAIGLAIFLLAGTLAFVRGYMVPNTTVEGEIAAAQWRGYAASVSDRAYEPNLDTDLPYIVALGLLGKMAPRLKAASERGYSPSWFRVPADQTVPVTGFYPYWIVFHTSMTPVSSGGSASGGYSGGGAAGGGGGSAGGF